MNRRGGPASGSGSVQVFRAALGFVLAVSLVFGPSVPVLASSVERVVVLAPSGSVVEGATAQLLGEFFRQEVGQDPRFQLVRGGEDGCADPACAAVSGRRLGAGRVLWCTIRTTDAGYVLDATATDVESSARLGSAEVQAETEDGLFVAAGAAIGGLLDALAAPPVAQSAPDAAPGPDFPGVFHLPIESAPVGHELPVSARVSGGLGDHEIYVMFQVGESPRVRYTQLRPAGNEGGEVLYVSAIPSSALTSVGLRYYLRVADASGAEVARYPASGWWPVETSADPGAPVRTAEREDTPGVRGGGMSGDGAGRDELTADGGAGRRANPAVAEGEGGSSRRWWWIGGAAAVVVGGALAILGGGDGGGGDDPVDPGPSTLPDPPEHQ